jgi:hypothetical protein
MTKHNNRSSLVLAIAVIAVSAAVALNPVAVFGEETAAEKVELTRLAAKPDKYVGKEIRLEGMVSRVIKDKQMFLVVDKTACGGCPSKQKCGVFELPVAYDGKMPKTRKKVAFTGVLTQPEEGKYLFKAKSLD